MSKDIATEELHEDKEFLAIQKHVKSVQGMYEADKGQDSFNALICGESGTGKTFILRTARKPVHIDSFDKGGTKCLKPEIDRGEIIVDTRYEAEEPLVPKAFALWKEEFKARVRLGYFNHIGTYVLDSSTTWAAAIMNHILGKANIAGHPPRFTRDYSPQKAEINNWLHKCLNLPCDFITTGHLEMKDDQSDSGGKFRYMTTGKGVTTLPLLFDELYVLNTKEGAEGINYRLLTGHTGLYLARTRIGRDKWELYEEPDIKKLLKKAGLPAQDKPLFK